MSDGLDYIMFMHHPLIAAVIGKRPEIARAIVEAGRTDVNAVFSGDLTALGLAAGTGQLGLVRLFVAAGARPPPDLLAGAPGWEEILSNPKFVQAVDEGLSDRPRPELLRLLRLLNKHLLPRVGERGVVDVIAGYTEPTFQDWLTPKRWTRRRRKRKNK